MIYRSGIFQIFHKRYLGTNLGSQSYSKAQCSSQVGRDSEVLGHRSNAAVTCKETWILLCELQVGQSDSAKPDDDARTAGGHLPESYLSVHKVTHRVDGLHV